VVADVWEVSSMLCFSVGGVARLRLCFLSLWAVLRDLSPFCEGCKPSCPPRRAPRAELALATGFAGICSVDRCRRLYSISCRASGSVPCMPRPQDPIFFVYKKARERGLRPRRKTFGSGRLRRPRRCSATWLPQNGPARPRTVPEELKPAQIRPVEPLDGFMDLLRLFAMLLPAGGKDHLPHDLPLAWHA